MIRAAGLIFFLTLAACGLSAGASGPDKAALIERALLAYAEAQASTELAARLDAFARSHRLFAQASAAGDVSAALYANQGTAALQAESLGHAVYAFRKALALEPSLTRAAQNLEHARNSLPAWVPRPSTDSLSDTFFFWQQTLSTSQLLGLAAVCFLAAAVCLAVGLIRTSRFARGTGILFACVWLVLLSSGLGKLASSGQTQAVVILDDTIARAADSINSPARFAQGLPAGTEVSVVETRGGWVRIRLANGREAWVRAPAVQSLDL